MKIAAVAYAPERHATWDALVAKLDALIADAGADLVVLPEYAGVEAALVNGPAEVSPMAWRDLTVARADDWIGLCRDLAVKHQVHFLGGTTLVATDRGVVNRAVLALPSGEVVFQDKVINTPYERDIIALTGGEALRLFDTSLGKIGILICYDSEFPLLARRLAEEGADMILVPSCTDFAAGQTRVRQSCRARAIEEQCLIVQAPLVGGVAGCDIVDVNTGRAGMFAPPDHGLPPDGIIAQGETDVHGAVVAEVDPAAIAAPRHSGQVGNFRHWTEQARHTGAVELIACR